MERSKFIAEFKRLVNSGEITTSSLLQVSEDISRSKVDGYTKKGFYEKVKVGKIYLLIEKEK